MAYERGAICIHASARRRSRRVVTVSTPRRRLMLRSSVCAAVLMLGVTGGTGAGVPASASPPDYSTAGPFKVVTARLVGSGGAVFDVFRPSSYEAMSASSPIVTWGNGTGANPDDYTTLFDHLASWGFTVVASTLPNTGSGLDILAGARDLVAADRHRGSLYFRHLATTEIAAAGHSQGATGAVRAGELARSFISTVVTFSLPWNGQGPIGSVWDRSPGSPQALGWSGANPDCATARDCWPNPGGLHQPTFLISTRGPIDAVIANAAVERCYFEAVRAPAALGIVRESDGKVADHASIEDAKNGGNPDGFLGVTTAWLLAELRHDTHARSLFFGPHPALLKAADWSGSRVKRVHTAATDCR
jgi:hypothetical protein